MTKVGIIECRTAWKDSDDDTFPLFLQGQVETIGQALQQDLDILLAPENFLSVPQPYTLPQYEELKARLKEISAQHKALIAPGTAFRRDEEGKVRNTCPVMARGELLLEYSKKFLITTWDDRYASIMEWNYEGSDNVGFFLYNGAACGIEICVDHHIGKLMQSLGNSTKLTLHLVPSSQNMLHQCRTNLLEGGLLMRADGYRPDKAHPWGYLYQQKGDLMERIKPAEKHPLINGKLNIYEVEGVPLNVTTRGN